jgi:hypothetical protein
MLSDFIMPRRGGGQSVVENLLIASLIANPENTAEPVVVNDIFSK